MATVFYYADKADPDWRKRFDDWLDWSHDALQRVPRIARKISMDTPSSMVMAFIHKMGDGQAFAE